MAFAGTSYEETNAVATLQYCIRKRQYMYFYVHSNGLCKLENINIELTMSFRLR